MLLDVVDIIGFMSTKKFAFEYIMGLSPACL